MEHPVRRIINRWPSRSTLAADMGLNLVVVHRWYQRRSIPGHHFSSLLRAAEARGIPLTTDELVVAVAAPDHKGHTGPAAAHQPTGKDEDATSVGGAA